MTPGKIKELKGAFMIILNVSRSAVIGNIWKNDILKCRQDGVLNIGKVLIIKVTDCLNIKRIFFKLNYDVLSKLLDRSINK